MTDIDVIVGGGGVAGIAAAAAMQQLGYRVMLVEPGLNDARRFAGEVFHPPGVTGLAELGLLNGLMHLPAVKVKGFCVSSNDDCIELPYDSVPTHRMPGLCLEHGLIRERMLNAVTALPNIMFKRGARVVGIDESEPSRLVVGVATKHQVATHYRCRMLIAADGAPSRLARLAGIAVHSCLISTIWGYRVSTEHLPKGEYGHVFLGANTPILLYPIGRGEARILFDIPYQAGRRPTAADCLDMAEALPPALRQAVERAIAMQPRMSILARAVTVERTVQGRLVLVGDAGGSCHPLTATGMTMCISDALLLRKALIDRTNDVSAALQIYQRCRRWPQATRLALADALRDALCGTSPELRVVRSGLLAYWKNCAAGRSATLALVSTADGRPLAFMRQIITVMARGFVAHLRSPSPANYGFGPVHVVRKLTARLLRHIKQVLIGPPMSACEPGRLVGSVSRPVERRSPSLRTVAR